MSTATKGAYRVLLFEDTIDDEQLAVRALKASGAPLEIEVARNGVEALEKLGLGEETKEVPNLVISDLKMPRMSGADILKLVRENERFAQAPFVIFSSSDEAQDVERCMNLGASAYCVKPIDYSEFRECVIGIVKRWLLNEKDAGDPPCALDSE